MANRNGLYLLSIVFIWIQCTTDPQWKLTETIDIEGVNPIGITMWKGSIWLSDGDHNRVVEIDNGKIGQSIEGFERPMHITSWGTSLYVPEYTIDTIRIIDNGVRSALPIRDSLEAPSGIDVSEGAIAIADFYNHRVLLQVGEDWKSVGKKGRRNGEFHYPTDVKLKYDKLYVADAYNNRVQVFDLDGNHLATVGHNENMNAATGIDVDDEENIYVTDFENSRILIFDKEGTVKQILEDSQLSKPAEILVVDDILYVPNFEGETLLKYSL